MKKYMKNMLFYGLLIWMGLFCIFVGTKINPHIYLIPSTLVLFLGAYVILFGLAGSFVNFSDLLVYLKARNT